MGQPFRLVRRAGRGVGAPAADERRPHRLLPRRKACAGAPARRAEVPLPLLCLLAHTSCLRR
eukprot:3725459-Pleurochrysis_carterae.AAC.1